MVLWCGSAESPGSRLRSLRPPQAGYCSCKARTAFSNASLLLRGQLDGRRERSNNPACPCSR
ncbi:hypothetical protein D3C80_1990200 [compost metagenome]